MAGVIHRLLLEEKRRRGGGTAGSRDPTASRPWAFTGGRYWQRTPIRAIHG
jgi:hypothetical protein